MKTIRLTAQFRDWFDSLRDVIAKRQINKRLARIAAMDHFGDFASVGDGVSELRIHVGPGYRVYYTLRSEEIVVVLGGGDKGSQDRDIEKAKELAGKLDEE